MDATQQKGSPKQLRGRSLGTKLSEAEYALCEKSAARRGQTLSEWCRQVLLAAVESPDWAPGPPCVAGTKLCYATSQEAGLSGVPAIEPLWVHLSGYSTKAK